MTQLDLNAYTNLPTAELVRRVTAVREQMGSELVILGHHYQTNDVIEQSDLRGDSFQLSALAADNRECRVIVFCGVHFMAETADILANRPDALAERDGRRVTVMLPDLEAGCPMADMANRRQVETCWDALSDVIDTDDVMPVTYVNSSAEMKAFCGRNGGIVCTSSNARKVLEWAFSRRQRVLFCPDQHLGRNTAADMGMTPEQMPLWQPDVPGLGGNTPEQIEQARVILWDGYCCVHQRFLPEYVETLRREHPGIRVIVHPESTREVVECSDDSGSTGAIVKAIKESEPGSCWAIGTEYHLVQRLAEQYPDREIYHMSPEPSICRMMSKITLPNLCWTLESLAAGNPINKIHVEESTARDAELALVRMLECS